jgi:hypothetical protein
VFLLAPRLESGFGRNMGTLTRQFLMISRVVFILSPSIMQVYRNSVSAFSTGKADVKFKILNDKNYVVCFQNIVGLHNYMYFNIETMNQTQYRFC